MTAAEAQTDMFPDLPTIKMPKRVRSRWEDLNELVGLVNEHGPLLPAEMAADLLDISKQRVWQLVGDGKLQTVEFRGRRYITEKVIRAFVEVERKTGRPMKEPNVKTAWKMAKSLAGAK